jgi:hypothetical protein
MKITRTIKAGIALCLVIAGCSGGSTSPEEEEVYEFYYRVTITDDYGSDPEIQEPGQAQVTWRDGHDQPHDNFNNPVQESWESPVYEGMAGLKATMTITELTDYRKTITGQIFVDGQLVADEQKVMEETRTQGLTVEYELGDNSN